MRSASKSPEVSLLASRESEIVSTATPSAVNARSASILPPGIVSSPSEGLAQFIAHEGVHGFALGSASLEQLFQLGSRSFSERAILEGRCVDVDVQRRAS